MKIGRRPWRDRLGVVVAMVCLLGSSGGWVVCISEDGGAAIESPVLGCGSDGCERLAATPTGRAVSRGAACTDVHVPALVSLRTEREGLPAAGAAPAVAAKWLAGRGLEPGHDLVGDRASGRDGTDAQPPPSLRTTVLII